MSVNFTNLKLCKKIKVLARLNHRLFVIFIPLVKYILHTFIVSELFHFLTKESALRSFHVIRLWNGSPVFLSHVIKVDLWVEIPNADISSTVKPAPEKWQFPSELGTQA